MAAMKLNLKYIIFVFGVFVVVAIGMMAFNSRRQAQAEAQAKVETAHQELARLVELYAQRTQLYSSWREQIKLKAAKEKIPMEEISEVLLTETLKANLVSKQDLDRFDQTQNLVSAALGHWLANPAALKLKPQGLEKIEESINRSRARYHELATEAMEIQKKYWLKVQALPLLDSEVIRSQSY